MLATTSGGKGVGAGVGFNNGKSRKSYFWKSYSIHVLATSGGKGVGVGCGV